MQTLETLRCTNCGAPLPDMRSGEFIKCEYCGYSQRLADVEKYLEQLKTEVFGWIKSMIPTGVSAGMQTTDPIARSQLFDNVIKPRITEEFNPLNMQLIKYGSYYLTVPLFATAPPPFAVSVDPRVPLNSAAKFEGLAPLAVSDEQISFINNLISTSEALGHIMNIVRLSNEKSRDYKLITRNLESAVESLNRSPSKVAEVQRFKSLALMSGAIVSLLDEDPNGALLKLQEADRWTSESLKNSIKNPSTAAWYPGIKAEKTICDGLKAIAEASQSSIKAGIKTSDVLAKFAKYVSAFEEARGRSGLTFGKNNLVDPNTFQEVSKNFKDVIQGRVGDSSVVGLIGSGNVWLACWSADLNYSFETGALFMKKGQSVQERMLINGTFTLYPDQAKSASHTFVTDLFSVRAPSGFWDGITGKEKTLTTGIGYNALSQIRKTSIPASASVIPPYCTKDEAEKMAEHYLSQVGNQLRGKLKFSVPSITQLIYVSGEITGNNMNIPGLPNSMALYVGDSAYLERLSI